MSIGQQVRKPDGIVVAIGFGVVGGSLLTARGAPTWIGVAVSAALGVLLLGIFVVMEEWSSRRTEADPWAWTRRAESAQHRIRKSVDAIDSAQADDLRARAGDVVEDVRRIERLATEDRAKADEATRPLTDGVHCLEDVANELREQGNTGLDGLVRDLAQLHRALMAGEKRLRGSPE